MIVEVIAVGTELLLGQIENTNASRIARRLAEEGLDSHYQVVVGDNLGRLTDAIRTALGRADVVILTGGVGPTQDDLTREAICEVTGREMTRDQDHAEWIHRRITSQGHPVRENQFRMADLPESAEPIPNRTGVALGVCLEHDRKLIFALPGVPAEMLPMLDEEVLPRIRIQTGEPRVLVSRVLKTWGHGESTIADMLQDLYEQVNPSIAFLIKDMEVLVRITAKAEDTEAARLLIEPVEEKVREKLGEAVFAVDDETVEANLVSGLTARGWTVATVERATLGQVAARIASVEGSERCFRGSILPPARGEQPAPPDADVLLEVSEIGSPAAEAQRSTRPVKMTVTTPKGGSERVFQFGGDDERLRAYATGAGLHMLRMGID